MRTHLNCASCIIDDLCGALNLVPLKEDTKNEILKESFRFLSREFSTEKILSYFITEVHRILKKISGIEIPFQERRDKRNQLGIEMAEKINLEAERLKESERFSFLVNWAIASNHLDFRTVGTGYGFQMAEIIEDGETVGLQGAASKIILAGPDTLGISLNEMSDQLKRELQTADLVIAKCSHFTLSKTQYNILFDNKNESR
ncbi:hypothetical protein KJ813_03510 [bacterium]|nr:hypothetical protein [bacterium]MBU4602882.1 hypothetical protein [bacterium]